MDKDDYPNCAGFIQGQRMEEGYCGECGGHITDPIHQNKDNGDLVEGYES